MSDAEKNSNLGAASPKSPVLPEAGTTLTITLNVEVNRERADFSLRSGVGEREAAYHLHAEPIAEADGAWQVNDDSAAGPTLHGSRAEALDAARKAMVDAMVDSFEDHLAVKDAPAALDDREEGEHVRP